MIMLVISPTAPGGNQDVVMQACILCGTGGYVSWELEPQEGEHGKYIVVGAKFGMYMS